MVGAGVVGAGLVGAGVVGPVDVDCWAEIGGLDADEGVGVLDAFVLETDRLVALTEVLVPGEAEPD